MGTLKRQFIAPALYIVATPIGNLKDITLRVLEVFKEVDMILCEDTRHTSRLLAHYGISKPLVSYFQHSKLSKVEYIIDQLRHGKKIALVTDAGTPGISDPGGQLIKHITGNMEHGVGKIKIVPIPGPSAVTAALSISGFPTDKFIFMGFPPHKKGRGKFFKEVAETKYTVVFYESVHRIKKTLKKLIETQNLTERQIVVCRELTKMYETVYRGSPKEILKILERDKNTVKGEFVVVISGNS